MPDPILAGAVLVAFIAGFLSAGLLPGSNGGR